MELIVFQYRLPLDSAVGLVDMKSTPLHTDMRTHIEYILGGRIHVAVTQKVGFASEVIRFLEKAQN